MKMAFLLRNFNIKFLCSWIINLARTTIRFTHRHKARTGNTRSFTPRQGNLGTLENIWSIGFTSIWSSSDPSDFILVLIIKENRVYRWAKIGGQLISFAGLIDCIVECCRIRWHMFVMEVRSGGWSSGTSGFDRAASSSYNIVLK